MMMTCTQGTVARVFQVAKCYQARKQTCATGGSSGGGARAQKQLTASISSDPFPTGTSTVLGAAMATTCLLLRATNTERESLLAAMRLEAMQPAGLAAPWIIAALRSGKCAPFLGPIDTEQRERTAAPAWPSRPTRPRP